MCPTIFSCVDNPNNANIVNDGAIFAGFASNQVLTRPLSFFEPTRVDSSRVKPT